MFDLWVMCHERGKQDCSVCHRDFRNNSRKVKKKNHDTIRIPIQDPSRFLRIDMKSHMLTVCENRSYLKNVCILENLHSVLSVLHHQLWSQLHSTVASLLGILSKKNTSRTDFSHLKKNPCLPSPRCLSPLRFLVYSDESPTRLYVSLVAMATEKNGGHTCRPRCATRHTRQAQKRSKRPSSLHLLFQVSQKVCDILHVVRNIDTR